MTLQSNWQIAPARQPKPEDYPFELDHILSSVVGLRARVPEGAFTAETLGTERAGTGVVIRDGVVLTIGYLVTEAEEIWLTTTDGLAVPGHPLAYDQVTGFGLVQALGTLDLAPLPLGRSGAARVGASVIVAAVGGRAHALAAHIVARQEFAGYWEYVLDEAIFTAPAHPLWGGAAVISEAGELLGIGSLQLEQAGGDGESGHLNMVVPIDLLHPVLPDLLTSGRANRPPRPWLGLFATEIDDSVYIAGLSTGGPAAAAGLEIGDMVVAVAGREVTGLAQFFRSVWGLGTAGVEVPLTLVREGRGFTLSFPSGDRDRFLKAPRMHS